MKIAIIGAGIVGSTCAYYLSKEKNVEVTVFDHGLGQATKAAAGIISPWFSKRRNKAWYEMARKGADFYTKLIADLKQDGQVTDFYEKNGVFILKKDESKLDELLEIAKNRKEESPIIGDLEILDKLQAQNKLPYFDTSGRVLYASGAARISGEKLVNTLISASAVKFVKKKVDLAIDKDILKVDGELFDKVVLCAGAWLGDLLTPLGFDVDVKGQKGQLRDYRIEEKNTNNYPLLMPEGEIDIIFFDNGLVTVGASHENDKAFDLEIDNEILDRHRQEAESYVKAISKAKIDKARVGTRAYTSDFSPFYGPVQEVENLYLASGLGSSGLTTGPIIAYDLSRLILCQKTYLDYKNYPVNRYVKKKIK